MHFHDGHIFKLPALNHRLISCSAMALIFVSLSSPVHAQQAIDPGTLGGTHNIGISLSGNGAVATGRSYLTGNLEEHAFRWENGSMTDLGTLGGTFSIGTDLTFDGSVIVGFAGIAGDVETHAFRWENGVITDLGTLGGTFSGNTLVSADGNIVIGDSLIIGDVAQHAFRWESGVMTDLGTLGGTNSSALDLSADGSVVVGMSQTVGNTTFHAFRWESGVLTDIGTLGGSYSSASRVSADGTIIAGSSDLVGNAARHAYRWVGSVMTDLGTLGGTDSSASLMTGDGSVIVGLSEIAGDTETHVFHWQGGTMTDVGTLGGTISEAYALSADGSIIAGESKTAGDLETHAFRWTQADGMQDLMDILVNAGTSPGGWDVFNSVTGMSADGQYMAGLGSLNGQQQTFLFSMTGGGGVTTFQDLGSSLLPVAESSRQTRSVMTAHTGQSLFAARNALGSYFYGAHIASAENIAPADVEPAAGPGFFRGAGTEYKHAYYALGSFGAGQGNNDFDNTVFSGNTGVLFKVADDFAIGAGMIGSTNEQDTYLGGDSRINAIGGTLLAAYEPDIGLRFYATANAADITLSTDRRYINGGGIDSSSGDTDGKTYSAALRTGYAVPLRNNTDLIPYVEAEWSRVTLDGYTERGGPFPASVEDQDGNTLISRLGTEVSHDFNETFTLRGRAAWGHRYTDGHDVEASAANLSFSVPEGDGDKNWVEGGITGLWNISDRTTFSTDVGGRTGETSEPALNVTVGAIFRF